ncbi:MAG: hypothetical protein ACRD1T_20025, partial [Acidimicrobiia bacterium]
TEVTVDDTAMITGKDGFSGPIVTISRVGEFETLCLMQLPEWALSVRVIERSTNRELVLVDGLGLEDSHSFSVDGEITTCPMEDFPDEVHGLIDHPDRYKLEIRGAGRREVTKLTDTRQSDTSAKP